MSFLSRRDFIKDSAVLAALAAAGGVGKAAAKEKSEKAAPSGDAASQLRVAVIGVHGRGKDHVKGFAGRNNCVVTTICDADSDVIGGAMKHRREGPGSDAEVRTGHPQSRRRQGHRHHLHRHAEPLALAGRHLGPAKRQERLRRKAGQPQRQRGPAQSSRSPARRTAFARRARRAAAAPASSRPCSSSRDGKLGKISVARGLCYKPRGSIGKVDGSQQTAQDGRLRSLVRAGPDEAGDAQAAPLRLALVLGLRQRRPRQPGHPRDGQGPLGLDKNELAKGVLSVGGRFGYIDDGQTANTQICVFDYGDSELIFEVRGLQDRPAQGREGRQHHLRQRRLSGHRRLRQRHGVQQRRRGHQGLQGRRRPLRQLRGGRAQRQGRGPPRRHRGRPPVQRPVPSRQHQLPSRHGAAVRPEGRRSSATTRPRRRRWSGWNSISRTTRSRWRK